jgi:hypothetical protein
MGRIVRAHDEPRTIFKHVDSKSEVTYHAVWNSVLYQDSPGAADREAAPPEEQLTAALAEVSQSHTKWGIVMSSGGHFAAAVFNIQRSHRAGNEWAEPAVHKTFHRNAPMLTISAAFWTCFARLTRQVPRMSRFWIGNFTLTRGEKYAGMSRGRARAGARARRTRAASTPSRWARSCAATTRPHLSAMFTILSQPGILSCRHATSSLCTRRRRTQRQCTVAAACRKAGCE